MTNKLKNLLNYCRLNASLLPIFNNDSLHCWFVVSLSHQLLFLTSPVGHKCALEVWTWVFLSCFWLLLKLLKRFTLLGITASPHQGKNLILLTCILWVNVLPFKSSLCPWLSWGYDHKPSIGANGNSCEANSAKANSCEANSAIANCPSYLPFFYSYLVWHLGDGCNFLLTEVKVTSDRWQIFCLRLWFVSLDLLFQRSSTVMRLKCFWFLGALNKSLLFFETPGIKVSASPHQGKHLLLVLCVLGVDFVGFVQCLRTWLS